MQKRKTGVLDIPHPNAQFVNPNLLSLISSAAAASLTHSASLFSSRRLSLTLDRPLLGLVSHSPISSPLSCRRLSLSHSTVDPHSVSSSLSLTLDPSTLTRSRTSLTHLGLASHSTIGGRITLKGKKLHLAQSASRTPVDPLSVTQWIG